MRRPTLYGFRNEEAWQPLGSLFDQWLWCSWMQDAHWEEHHA